MSKELRYQTVIIGGREPVILPYIVHEPEDESDIKSIKKQLSSIENLLKQIKSK